MPSQIERVELAQFSVTTHADQARILQVASRGMQVAKRAMESSMTTKGSGPGQQRYSTVRPGGFVAQVQAQVKRESAKDGTTRVRLVTGNYLTSRQTFMFIPLTPKMVRGLGSLERFTVRLSAGQTVPAGQRRPGQTTGEPGRLAPHLTGGIKG